MPTPRPPFATTVAPPSLIIAPCALDPAFLRARRGLVTMQMKIGNVELDTAPALALTDFRGAMVKLDALPRAEQSRLDLTRTRALLLRKQAFALSELGRYAEANPLFEASTSIYQKIAAADPKDARALRDLNRLLTNEIASYESAADPLLAAPGSSASNNIAAERKFAGRASGGAGTTLGRQIPRMPRFSWSSRSCDRCYRMPCAVRLTLHPPLNGTARH